MFVSMRSPGIWATAGSTLASFFFFWEIIRRYCPPQLRRYVDRCTQRLLSFFDPNIQISIHEMMGSNLKPHKAYARVEAYLSDKSSKSAKKLKAEMSESSNKLMLSMDEYERVTDEFNGVEVLWISSKVMASSARMTHMSYSYNPEPEKRVYRLRFHRRYREMIIESYLEHVMKTGKEMRAKRRHKRLYTNSNRSMWSHIVFKHPATFDTLAMEAEKKQAIIEDLQTFTKSKGFYARIGKAWKRGYLLYGPPGTGKSTMIAAMANLLDYNVYDLELTSVRDNTELRRLLTETTSKSIIVIEDIDCSLDLTGQRKTKEEKVLNEEAAKCRKENSSKDKEDSSSKVTLSGLLNFIDGLWSTCTGERLIVFTTNYVDKLDPALTRRGRMDKHIELSYCSFEGFKVLAKNYLELEEHPQFETIGQMLKETKITPADVAENLMPKSQKEDAEKCLLNLIQALQNMNREQTEKAGSEALKEEKLIKEEELQEKPTANGTLVSPD